MVTSSYTLLMISYSINNILQFSLNLLDITDIASTPLAHTPIFTCPQSHSY